ncbi:uncharacterized oxidoreductase At1g06690, chloroplastic-like [Neltuma alba]|uniref:uncharacterized oxidoreductase At1g06690, chloroplastic-like n=1 Tax=Neltuma alba TaxID=207710 RepID=UPI0010A42003|nr:uncharacterized oxidoreductase At1g06690, chloroplastic-like [Prosopis alba]
MALHLSSAWFGSFLGHSRVQRVKSVASKGSATLKTEEEKKIKLGGSDLKVTKLGIGAWSWGDITFWNNFKWTDKDDKAARDAFNASVDGGLTFFDTAEITVLISC